MAPRHQLLVLCIVSLWAFNSVAIKWGLVDLPPLFLTLMRFVVVSVLLVPFCRVRRAELRYLVPLAFTFGFMHFSLLFVGTRYTDAGTSAILVQLGTPFSMILAMLVLKEKLSLQQIVGILLSLTGVMVISGSPTIPHWWVLCLLLTSAAGWAISNMIVKKSPPIKPLTMSAWVSCLAIPIVGAASLLLEQDQWSALQHASWRGWFAILYSAIGSSILAYSLWYGLIRKYTVNMLMPWSLLTPVLAVLFGILVLGDSLNQFKLIGAALVVTGTCVAVVNRSHLRALWRFQRARRS
ncbi:DMT family transporter [Pantoea sp. 1.19]|uniref:DMT family transporter n=1 Tax=Pantoea sp. 1.19 TaxID=1925589 RepID=UPI0009490C8F|nr:EamA family transporter [Pantoea sp. 1.19]